MNRNDTTPALDARATGADYRRVLVTGGAGFIGRRVVERLAAEGRHVAVLDNLSSGLPMPAATALVEPYHADIRDEEALRRIVAGFRPDAVVHLAAVHHIPTCERERGYALDVNVVGTERVLAAAEEGAVERIVLASSGAVYDLLDGPLDEDRSPLVAHDNYALSKLTTEHQAAFWARRTGRSVRIARIFNTIGHDDPNAHLLPDIFDQIGSGTGPAVVALGNTAPKRDYIHADDTAAGVAAMLLNGTTEGLVEAFNLCSGREYSVAEVVALIGDLCGRPLRIEQDPRRMRPVDRLHQVGCTSKTAARLDWRASMSLPEALATIVRARGMAAPIDGGAHGVHPPVMIGAGGAHGVR